MNQGYIFLILFLLLLGIDIIVIILYWRKRVQRKKEMASQIDYVARMAHDMRTPIYAIDGYALLAEKCLEQPEKLEEHIKKIKRITQQLLAVVNDSVDYSKLQNHKMVLQNQETNFKKWLSICLEQIEVQTENKGVRFVKDINLLHERFLLDQDKLSKILLNLLSNALKYTDQTGEIRFSVTEEEQDDLFSGFVFVVEDTGIGMSQEFQKHIFEPFSQERIINTDVASSGLGMYLVKSLADLLKGNLEIYSKEEVGTKIIFTVAFKRV